MSLALQHFAEVRGIGPRKQVILVLDQAGWHPRRAVPVPAGLHLVFLPAHTPKLQPAEQLWPLVHEALANEGFSDLDALEERLIIRCCTLAADAPRVKAHTQFHW